MTLPSREVLKLVGWIVTGAVSAATGTWRFLEWRYVNQPVFQQHLVGDSLHSIHDAVVLDGINGRLQIIQQSADEANSRLRQIQCGPRVANGCR